MATFFASLPCCVRELLLLLAFQSRAGNIKGVSSPTPTHIVNLIMVIEIKAPAPLQSRCNKPEDAIIDFPSSAVKTNGLTSEFLAAPLSQISRIL